MRFIFGALVVESTNTVAGLNIAIKRVILPMENEDSTSIRNPLVVEYSNENSIIKTAVYNSTTETVSFTEPVLGTYSIRVKDSDAEFSTWVPVASQLITVN